MPANACYAAKASQTARAHRRAVRAGALHWVAAAASRPGPGECVRLDDAIGVFRRHSLVPALLADGRASIADAEAGQDANTTPSSTARDQEVRTDSDSCQVSR